MPQQNIYQRAKQKGCHLEATCVSCTQDEWDELMKGHRKADRKKVVVIAALAGVIDERTAYMELKHRHYNPYPHYVTKTHIVYVNSAIEHFIKVN